VVCLLTYYFDQHPFPAPPVKFSIENPFPGTEIQPTIGNGYNHFPTHDLPFHVGIGIILTNIVMILGYRFMGRQFLQPDIVIVVQAALIVINENAGCDVHGIDQYQPLLDPAFVNALLDLAGDIDKRSPGGHFEPQFFAIAFHFWIPFGLINGLKLFYMVAICYSEKTSMSIFLIAWDTTPESIHGKRV
jgi:hypothetical protein